MSSDNIDRIRLCSDVPEHVAIIMDGNGRWAGERGLPRHLGHREGMNAVRESVEGAIAAGVQLLTLSLSQLKTGTDPLKKFPH